MKVTNGFVFAFWILGCSNGADPSTDTSQATDVSTVELDASKTDGVADPCATAVERLSFEQLNYIVSDTPTPKAFDFDYSSSPELTSGRVENGELILNFAMPDPPKLNDVRMTIHLRAAPAVPATISLRPRDTDSDGDGSIDAYSTTEVRYFVNESTSGIATGFPFPSTGGDLRIDTCPNEVGQFAIGEFVGLITSGAFSDSSQIDGVFSIKISESDGSLLCGAPTICTY